MSIYINNESIIEDFKLLLKNNGIKHQFVADSLNISKQSLNLKFNKKHISFDDMEELLNCIGYDLDINFVKREK